MTEPAIIHTDGGSRGNPGPAAYAYVIQVPGQAVIEEKSYLGSTTNNVAEYTGLVRALEHARELGLTHLKVYSDSELMVCQLNGTYKVRNAGLLPLYRRAVELIGAFASVKVGHVRREYNKHADALCNEAMDSRSVSARDKPAPAAAPQKSRVPAPPTPPAPESAKPARAEAAGAPCPGTLQKQAIALLTDFADRCAHDDDPPSPEEVWQQLWGLIQQQGK